MIRGYIESIVDKKLEPIVNKFSILESSLRSSLNKAENNKEVFNVAIVNLKHDLDILVEKIVDKRMLEFYSQIRAVRDDLSAIDKRMPMTKEELEVQLDGIIKIFETKLDVLGYKKIITTDLLKKLAKLENSNVPS